MNEYLNLQAGNNVKFTQSGENLQVNADNQVIELIAVSDTAPAECNQGDKYFNTTNNQIYTATAQDTWSETGETPIRDMIYIVFDTQTSYSWNGTNFVSVGGGSGATEIEISNTEPTDPDVKLWIDTGEVGSQASEITNEYSTSTGLGYSANYSNNLYNNSIEKILDDTYSFGFNGNNYATKIITLPNNISEYNFLYFLIGDEYGSGFFYDEYIIPANVLISGNSFRKRVFFASIQAYMEIKYNDVNKVFIQLEHNSAISGNKNVNIKVYSVVNLLTTS